MAPGRRMLSKVRVRHAKWVLPASSAIFVILVVALFPFAERDVRLASHGVPTTGKVTSARPYGERWCRADVVVTFQSRDGETHGVKSRRPCGDTPIGEEVSLVYDARSPSIAALDEDRWTTTTILGGIAVIPLAIALVSLLALVRDWLSRPLSEAHRRAAFALSILGVTIALWLGGFLVYFVERDLRFSRDGITTTGKVTHSTRSGGRSCRMSFTIAYESYDGVRRELSDGRECRDGPWEGQTRSIVYDRRNPKDAMLEDDLWQTTWTLVVVLLLSLGVSFGSFVVYRVRR